MKMKVIERFKKLSREIAFVAALCAVSVACDDNLVSNPEDIVFPADNVSYADHVQPLFNVGCNFSGCHSDASQAGFIRLTSWTYLFDTPGMVIPGKPNNSSLYQVVSGDLAHVASFQARINDNHIQGIFTWIEEGAKNN